MKSKCCAFTGHRPHKFPWKYDEANSRCVALKAKLTEQITKLAENGVADFYSGGADGVDCWASLIVLELRKKNPALRLHMLLPHEGQADRRREPAQERYHWILEQADSVEYVSQEYYEGCMLDRNHRLVEAAGLLLAVYNGERRGGTAAAVRYARKLGKKIIILDPVSLKIAGE
ncbi:SLOG family protein [Oscillospiraceae bacterium 42-9]